MARTITRHWDEFKRPNVTYRFNKGSNAHITTVLVPPGSDWTSDLHWHETHREFLKIVQGSAMVTVGDHTRAYLPSDGLITIERGVLHEWKRVAGSEETLIVEEWTDPVDGQKQLFFRNLCSSIIDLTSQPANVKPLFGLSLNRYILLQLWVIFRAYDNYPVFYRGPFMRIITYSVLIMADYIGPFLGIKACYEEYSRTEANKED